MGLFGPSWSWEEIKKKDAIMSEIKNENDRVLSRLGKMHADESYQGPSDGGGFIMMIGAVTFCFIWCIPLLLSQLSGLKEGDPLAIEVLMMVLSSTITWTVATIVQVVTKKITYKHLFISNYILSLIGLVLADLCFGKALDNMIWFLISFIISMILMLAWSCIFSAIGIIFVKIVGNASCLFFTQIKIHLKKKQIKNTKLYQKIIDKITKSTELILINSCKIEIIEENEIKSTIYFEKENYSDLNMIGRISLGKLIKQTYPVLKLKASENQVTLINKEYQTRVKQEKRGKKLKSENEKKLKKQKIKKGEDW